MDFTVLELNNLNVLAREGMCQMLAKNLPTESLQAGLDALKKLEKVIQFTQIETAKKAAIVTSMTQETQKVSLPPTEVITQNNKPSGKKKCD